MVARCRALAAHSGHGHLGTGIFSDDTACDVRVAHRMRWRRG